MPKRKYPGRGTDPWLVRQRLHRLAMVAGVVLAIGVAYWVLVPWPLSVTGVEAVYSSTAGPISLPDARDPVDVEIAWGGGPGAKLEARAGEVVGLLPAENAEGGTQLLVRGVVSYRFLKSHGAVNLDGVVARSRDITLHANGKNYPVRLLLLREEQQGVRAGKPGGAFLARTGKDLLIRQETIKGEGGVELRLVETQDSVTITPQGRTRSWIGGTELTCANDVANPIQSFSIAILANLPREACDRIEVRWFGKRVATVAGMGPLARVSIPASAPASAPGAK